MSENQPSQESLPPEQEISRLKEENRVLLEANAKLTQELEQAKEEAGTDYLTKLPNRKTLLYNLQIELEKVNRGGRLAVAMLDLDKFKQINDRFGHDRGDEVLVEFSNKIQDQLRGTDIFGRFGGEEFLLLLPLQDSTSPEDVDNILKRYRLSIRSINTSGESNNEDSLTISGGCVIIEKNNNLSTKEVLKTVDENLYQSKNSGRNRITLTHTSPSNTGTPKS